MKQLEKLMFSISLMDQVTTPAGKIANKINNLTNTATEGFRKMSFGAAGLMGTGYLLQAALKPAIEMDRALGEVKSLGVQDAALNKLNDTALKFSIQYGESAASVVSSAYDIQSAIEGLSGNELAKFTEASGVLAKATKSDAGTITNYMGTMYGVFKNQAAEMGKSNWVQLVAGQTASAVQMFKTTGSEMSSAFTTLGADATSSGVAMSEQMAILGQLQATMSGSEAGTKYRSFLAGIGKAQGELGLQFTDSHGRMLPMIDILHRIKGKYGDIDTVAKSDLLTKAFGRKESVAMIKLLMQDVGGLANNINKLGQVKGMDKAMQMAKAQIDPWQRFEAGVNAVRIVFGQALLPIINPVLEKLTEMATKLQRWTGLFPNITRVIGMTVLGLLGLVAGMAVFTILSGLWTAAVAAIGVAMMTWNGIIWLVKNSLIVLKAAWWVGWIASMVAGAAIMSVIQMAMLAWNGVIWLVNAALLANPITWIVLAIAALVAGVVMAIKYWDELMAAFSKMSVFDMLGGALDGLIDMLNMLPGINIGIDSNGLSDDVPSLSSKRVVTSPSGGLMQSFSNTVSNSDQGMSIGKVEIKTNQNLDAQNLAHQLSMAAG